MGKFRTQQQLNRMSSDDKRNTLIADDSGNTVIVEVGVQTGRGRDLQALSNMNLMKSVLERGTEFLH